MDGVEAEGFLTAGGRLAVPALELLMAELSLDEEATMEKRR